MLPGGLERPMKFGAPPEGKCAGVKPLAPLPNRTVMTPDAARATGRDRYAIRLGYPIIISDRIFLVPTTAPQDSRFEF